MQLGMNASRHVAPVNVYTRSPEKVAGGQFSVQYDRIPPLYREVMQPFKFMSMQWPARESEAGSATKNTIVHSDNFNDEDGLRMIISPCICRPPRSLCITPVSCVKAGGGYVLHPDPHTGGAFHLTEK